MAIIPRTVKLTSAVVFLLSAIQIAIETQLWRLIPTWAAEVYAQNGNPLTATTFSSLMSRTTTITTTTTNIKDMYRSSPSWKNKQLPPAKWPQTDDRLRKAIINGERIGPDTTHTIVRNGTRYYMWKGQEYEAPVDGQATVVSMFYDLSHGNAQDRVSGKRQISDYQVWVQNFLSSTDPLVFFCEPNSPWADFVREHRQHAPTILAYLPFNETVMHTNFNENFWVNEGLRTDTTRQSRRHFFKTKETRPYKLWNEKMLMVHETTLLNPFDTKHFFWLDAGYFRQRAVNGVIVRNDMSQNGLGPDQVLLQLVHPAKRGYMIAAGAWAGTALGIQNAYDHYWKTFWFMVQNDIWCVGIEQHILVHMCKSFPSVCLLNKSGYWFEFGEKWASDPKFNWASDAAGNLDPTLDIVIGNDNLLRRPQPLVSGKVTFPNDFPIGSLPGHVFEDTSTGRKRRQQQ